MKKVLLSLLAAVLILGALGAAGLTGYRYGFDQGRLSVSNGNDEFPAPKFGFGPQRMPRHNFGFHHEFGAGGFGTMQRGMRFGFFSPLIFLTRIAFWMLVIWAVYTLMARSGWRLTKTAQTTETQTKPAQTEANE